MNKQNAHEYLPLVQALADGKTLQYNHLLIGWVDTDEMHFDVLQKAYRVKPEPRTFEMWITSTGNMYPANTFNANQMSCERITVQEVLK